MSYHFSPQFAALVASEWIRVDHLNQCIAEMARLDFSVVGDRRSIRTMWNTATAQDRPVELHKRFPEGQAYVCLNDSDWSNKRAQLEQALDHKDSNNVQNPPPASGSSNNNANNQSNANGIRTSSFNDANTAFRQALRTMNDQMRTLDGVWDRAKFERRFTWNQHPTTGPSWGSLAAQIGEILPIAQVRIGNTNDRLEAVIWPGSANMIRVTAAHATPNLDIPADGENLVVWLIRGGGNRTYVQYIRAGNRFVPVTMAVVTAAD